MFSLPSNEQKTTKNNKHLPTQLLQLQLYPFDGLIIVTRWNRFEL